MLFYSKMVRIESPQVEPPATASLDSTTAPRLATATGGDATADTLKSLMQHILSTKEDEAQRRGTLSQKDCAAMLAAVPSVVVDGHVLQGPKLLSWFKEVTSTYLTEKYWASSYAFNATQGLFSEAPELLATWRQSTQSDPQVLQLKEHGQWLEAWNLVRRSLVDAHVGDRLMALRKKVKAPNHLLQHGDKTVAKVATAHLDDVQACQVLGLWDSFATIIRDLDSDAADCDGFHVTKLGFDLSDEAGLQAHHHVMEVLRTYLDRQRALELFGALRPDIQTFIENSESGKKLLRSCLNTNFGWDEVRTLATEFETREKSRDADTARQLKKLGIDVPKPGNGKGGRNAQARGVRGGGKGKDGKGKGRNGKGQRGTQRPRSQRGDAELVAGLDGIVIEHVQCYGCNGWGHVKKKQGVVNCPWWVTKPDGSEGYDANHKAANGAANPSAPGAVVAQVTPAPTATAVDIDALMEALALADGPDDAAVAEMKQVYLKASSRNAQARPVLGKLPACILGVLGRAPSGQNFKAKFGGPDGLGATEVVNDDSGSPVSLVSPSKAEQLEALGLAKPLPGKSLYDSFSGVVSASGHDLGYMRDVQVTLHPTGVDGKPSEVGYPIVVHVVTEYASEEVLLGTQQQMLWRMETSYRSGTKTITAPVASGGAEFTFPFSVSTDGTAVVPQMVHRIVPRGVEQNAPPLPDDGTPPAHWKAEEECAPDTVHDDDGTPPAHWKAEEECAPDTVHDGDELTKIAVAAIVTGEAGTFGSAWLESTPDVPVAGTSEELDRLNALKEELLKAADGCADGTDRKVKTVGEPKAAPRSNAKKKRLLQQRLMKSSPPRHHVRRAAAGVAGYAWLASMVWAAAVATAVASGVVPHEVHTFDHAAPLNVPPEGNLAAPRWSEPDDSPLDPNDPMAWKEQGQCYSAPSTPDQNASAPEVGAWADWQRTKPDDFEGRATKHFTLKEVRAAVNRVHGHPMFDTAVCAQVDPTALPPDVAAVVWEELKLDNNPKLCNDTKLRESALAMVEEVVDAFHKPAPLLRPILNKDGTPVQVHVHTTDEIPLSSRMYRVSPDRLPAMRDKLNEMLEQGVIRRSHSSWSSPLVFVPKPPGADGKPKWRCTVDMRQLNKKTVPYKYPTPHIDDLLQCAAYNEPELDSNGNPISIPDDLVREINGVTYTGPHRPRVWGHCDFFESFHEVEVAEGSRHKFAFQSPTHGLCEYTRLPMGWINSPAILQAVVQDICRDVYDGPGRHHGKVALGLFVWNYLDDCAIVAANDEEATHLYRWLFAKFAARGLTVRAAKSGLYLSQMTFVGHILDEKGIHADPKKVEAIRKLEVPTDAAGIRRLLGMCGYYRRYYPAPFARHTTALTKLLQKDKVTGNDVKFVWDNETQANFDFLTKSLADAVVLEHPDWSLPFSLRTDASKQGFAAVICQTIPATNRRRILAVASRQTIGAEKNYDPRELEVGCTVWAVQHFRSWLLHRHFFIETDHANTRWVLDYGLDKHNSKLQRWSAQLSEFDFEFTWKCGESMIEPDTLSRAPLPADPDEPPPLTSPMVTDMREAAEKMLATPRPVDATPMSREKAKALVMERRKRIAQQQPRPTKTLSAAAKGVKAVTFDVPAAIVAKNSAFCPDRPPADDEITTELPMAWSSTPPPNPSRIPSGAASSETSSWRAGNTTDPTLFVIAHGISTDAMAAQELGVAVVGGSEVDPKLAAAFSKRTGAKSYPGLEELIEGGKRGLYPELHGLDIVTSGVPCPYRSNAGSLTSRKGKELRKASSERHLFEKQVKFFEIFRPRAAMIEQPPPSATHLAEYMKVLQGMQECGYHCQHRVLNCAEHGDHTSRRRWLLTCFLHNGAIEWPPTHGVRRPQVGAGRSEDCALSAHSTCH